MPEVAEVEVPPSPIVGPSWVSRAQMKWGRVMSMLVQGLLHLQVSVACVSYCHSLNFDPSVFGMPVLLKCKAENIDASTAPLSPQPSLPLQPPTSSP